MTLSVAVMAVPERARFVDELVANIDHDHVQVVWDQHRDRCDTGLRAIQAYDPAASHHLVIQDDALVCRDLCAGIDRIIQQSGHHPISLYVGRVKPHPQLVVESFAEARRQGLTLLKMFGPLWGVGIVYPTGDIPELVDFVTAHDHPNYDWRVSDFYMDRGIDCLYTVPSLVDHRPVDENPSTIAGRTGNRQAHWFIGRAGSALTVDWSTTPSGVNLMKTRTVLAPNRDYNGQVAGVTFTSGVAQVEVMNEPALAYFRRKGYTIGDDTMNLYVHTESGERRQLTPGSKLDRECATSDVWQLVDGPVTAPVRRVPAVPPSDNAPVPSHSPVSARPKGNAAKTVWVDWAVSHGADRQVADRLTRNDLRTLTDADAATLREAV